MLLVLIPTPILVPRVVQATLNMRASELAALVKLSPGTRPHETLMREGSCAVISMVASTLNMVKASYMYSYPTESWQLLAGWIVSG